MNIIWISSIKKFNTRIENGCTSKTAQHDHKHLITVKNIKYALNMLKNDKKEEMD